MPDEIVPLLTSRGAEHILRVTTRSIRKLIRSGQLAHVQVGPGSVRFTREDLQAFIDRQRRKAVRDVH